MRSLLTVLCVVSGIAAAQSAATSSAVATITSTGNMNVPRNGQSTTLLMDGRVLIAGGNVACYSSLNCTRTSSAELYDPSNGKFTPTGSMSMPRVGHFAVLLPDGTVYVVGGWAAVSETASDDGFVYSEIYYPVSGTFCIAGSLPASFVSGLTSVVLLNNGSLLMLASGEAAVVNPVTGSFASGGARPPRGNGVPIVLPNGNVVVFPADITCPKAFEVETYLPSTNTFSHTPWPFASTSTDQDGDCHATGSIAERAVLLPSGKAFLTLTAAEPTLALPPDQTMLYDPFDASFRTTGSFLNAREGAMLKVLSDGSLLAIGGFDGNEITGTEVYNAGSGTFTASASLSQTWGLFGLALLNSGDVLLAGGLLFTNGASPDAGITSAEIYHPATALAAPLLASTNDQGQGAIWNATTGLIASTLNPVTAGMILSVYTTNLIEDGTIPPQVSLGGRFARVSWFGDAPGYLGYFQVNFVVPEGVTLSNTVPVRLSYLGRWSNAVTIAVQ